RKLHPQWLLVVMHHSGLFEEHRMPIATGIAWFHDAVGGEPIFAVDGTPIGRVSSASYGHTVSASLALGFVATDHAEPGTEVDVAILGINTRGVILAEPPFDPKGANLRS
ncbi:MAG: glycine cleavage T C-terminal barrel domain-containing protein, partial [Pseudomonadota bacterium]